MEHRTRRYLIVHWMVSSSFGSAQNYQCANDKNLPVMVEHLIYTGALIDMPLCHPVVYGDDDSHCPIDHRTQVSGISARNRRAGVEMADTMHGQKRWCNHF